MTGYGKRVLIVEHDENQRDVLSLMLENEGYIAHLASEECLALEEMKRRRFDVVISAHHLPHINGFRLALLVGLVWPDMPTILLLDDDTNLSDMADHDRAYGILPKPFVFTELLELMGNAIRLTREHRPRTTASILLSS